MEVVAVAKYGAVATLQNREVRPVREAEVLIKVRAAGMNPMDSSIADGAWADRYEAVFPLVLGADFAGVIEQVGSSVAAFSVGDEVFGQLLLNPLGSSGTYAEYVVAPSDAPLATVPRGVTAEVAAALPTAGGTALGILDQIGDLRGKTLVIVGAAGGVGSYLTQFAASAGATVETVASDRDAERLRAYGAATNYDRAQGSVGERVRAAHPDGVDVVVDLANAAPEFAALIETVVRQGGIAVSTRFAADVDALRETGVAGINFSANITPALLTRLANGIAMGALVPPPITTVALNEVPELLSNPKRGTAGKTVIVIDKP